MKKITLFLIALLTSMFTFAYDVEIDGIYYNLNDETQTAEVTRPKSWYSSTLNIPETLIYNNITYSVNLIKNWAFQYNDRLSSITIPNSITSIGENAFVGCTSLTSITIPNSVTYIGNSAFSGCTSLSSIIISNNNTYIGASAFENTLWFDNQQYGCIHIGNCLYKYKGYMPENTHIDIKEGTIHVCGYAFNNYSNLKSISFPNSLQSIGRFAFEDCTSLSSIIISDSVIEIETGAFYNCTSLTSVKLGNSLVSIESNAFYNCTSLTSIINPNLNSLTKIGEYAFYNCSALTSISIPNSINSIGRNAFYGCSALSALITMPNVSMIGDGAFYNCKSLSDITIGNNLKFIDENTFTNCTNLRTIKLGNSIESIGKDAFKGCTTLYSFEISTEIPPIINATTFAEVSSTLQIKVPCNSVEDYKASSYWNSFSNFKGISHTINANVNDDKMGQAFVIKQSTCQDITAQILAQALIGHKFVKWNDGYTDNPRTIIVTQDSTFTAEFVANKHNVTLSTENGIVDGAGIYNYGDTITISATPNDGYTFQKWSDGNTDNPRTIIVTEDITLSAEFTINTYNINTTESEYGKTTGAGTYNHGTEAILTATPNEGYHFTQWSDGNTDNPRTIIVTQDSTFTAQFAINTYNVTISAENGSVIGGGEYNHGEEATIAVIPNEGYTFNKWSDGNTDNPRKIIVTEDVNLIAILKSNSPSTNLDSNFNTEIRIYTTNGTLHIEGATSDYHILDAAGRLIYSGKASTLTLPRGIYLITMDGEVEKIVL